MDVTLAVCELSQKSCSNVNTSASAVPKGFLAKIPMISVELASSRDVFLRFCVAKFLAHTSNKLKQKKHSCNVHCLKSYPEMLTLLVCHTNTDTMRISLGYFWPRLPKVKVLIFKPFWPRIPMVKALFFLGPFWSRLPTVKVFVFLWSFLDKVNNGESFCFSWTFLAKVTFIGHFGCEYQWWKLCLWFEILSNLWHSALPNASSRSLEAISGTPLCNQEFALRDVYPRMERAKKQRIAPRGWSLGQVNLAKRLNLSSHLICHPPNNLKIQNLNFFQSKVLVPVFLRLFCTLTPN